MAILEMPRTRIVLSGRSGSDAFDVELVDGDVLEALRRYENLETGISALLKIGATATLAAATDLDLQLVRHELDRAVQEASDAMVSLGQNVREMVSDSGPFAAVVNQFGTQVIDVLKATLDSASDADQPGSFLNKVSTATRQIEQLLMWARTEIADELRRTSDRQAEHLSQIVSNARSMDASSPIAEAISRVEANLSRLTVMLAATQARSAERANGTGKGRDYEDEISAHVAKIVTMAGDRAERTANMPGMARGPKGASKKGDVTCFLRGTGAAEDLRIVVEIMDRDPRELTGKAIAAELREAMCNRACQVGIAVASSPEGSVTSGVRVVNLDRDLWVVVIEPGADPLPLEVVYRVARHVLVASRRRGEPVDLQIVRRSVEDLSRKLVSLHEARTQIMAIGGCQRKAVLALTEFERDIRGSISAVLDSLGEPSRRVGTA